MNPILWEPSSEQIKSANVTTFIERVNTDYALSLQDFADLHQWSIDNPETFWSSFWEFANIKADKGQKTLENKEQIIKAKWFSDSRINFAENLLQFADTNPNQTAIQFWGEDKVKRQLSQAELKHQVACVAHFLINNDIKAGDVVAGYMPNLPEAIVCMLATTSIGAIWTSCSPDFGVQGVLDRFGQVKPKVFISANAYYYNGKTHDCLAKVERIIASLDSIEQLIIIPYAHNNTDIKQGISYADIINTSKKLTLKYTRLPFNSPLYIMYSSGTTGVPKCIVHGIGGTLLQQLKEHLLHVDIKPQDKIFYFTTCGWMMWNWLVSALATGATIMLYDGSPFYPNSNILLDYAQKESFTIFGTSAKYIDILRKEAVDFTKTHPLPNLKNILSTGSVLCPESYDYIYKNIKQDVCLSSISGGTDILSCFALGAPTLPVRRGELQFKGLGMQVEIWNDEGHKVKEVKGELVCTKPFPSMPLYFWNDPDNKKYHNAYFASFDNIWCHGDYVKETQNGGFIFYGRSDTILNPGGVRIGTAEIYRQVENMPEVQESIVIGQTWQADIRVILFVKLSKNVDLNDALKDKIKKQIRENTTPRHVPEIILQVDDIPRTKSGKIVEIAVKNIVEGKTVKNLESLANPEALEFYKNRI